MPRSEPPLSISLKRATPRKQTGEKERRKPRATAEIRAPHAAGEFPKVAWLSTYTAMPVRLSAGCRRPTTVRCSKIGLTSATNTLAFRKYCDPFDQAKQGKWWR